MRRSPLRRALRSIAGLALLTAFACHRDATSPDSGAPDHPAASGSAKTASPAQPASYVGAAACSECHAAESDLSRGSDHALAMQEATDFSVLGDFRGRHVTAQGITSIFSKRDGRFVVRTDGPDGALRDFEIAYVFGVRPLQQYLVPFPGGRFQALGLAWDARPREAGGQRWFHLYPRERIGAGDALHWTGPQQNWNFMCAECHSTNLERRYDAASDSFATTWSEIDVACEACHGPGSAHVDAMRAASSGVRAGAGRSDQAAADTSGDGLMMRLPRFDQAAWAFDGAHPTVRRRARLPGSAEIDTCGRCHARRGWSWEEMVPGAPLADTHRIALLDQDLYFDDGQIREEVYEYGSFLQSRMQRAGVVCGDCHDPHSGKTRAEGNLLCARCHQAARFDVAAHHHHRDGSAGSRCVACHMPERTYMVIDPRRDHGLRVPRPDLSVAIGTPNACTGCHANRDAGWAAAAVVRWFPEGRSGKPHFGRALHEARGGAAGSAAALLEVIGDGAEAGIVRATALAALPHGDRTRQGAPHEAGILKAIAAAVVDPDPLVRRSAAEWIDPLPPEAKARLGVPLLGDPIRTVRLAAAATLAGLPDTITGDASPRLASAVLEYRRSLAFSADRAESQFNLGNLERQTGRAPEAESAYRRAIALDPTFVPSFVNLADLLAARGREEEAESILRDGLKRTPRSADIEHALGLAAIRRHDTTGALAHLEQAARLRPDVARYAYVHAVALHDSGNSSGAMRILEAAAARHENDADILEALVAYCRERRDEACARQWQSRLAP